MKLDNRTEIKYLDTTGTVSVFVLVLEGEITMRIYCDTAEAEPVIRVAGPTGNKLQDTNGRFALIVKLHEDGNGAPLGAETRVDRKSVYAYVLPRVHVLMGRLLRAA